MKIKPIIRGDRVISYCCYQLPETPAAEAGFSWEGAMKEPQESNETK